MARVSFRAAVARVAAQVIVVLTAPPPTLTAAPGVRQVSIAVMGIRPCLGIASAVRRRPQVAHAAAVVGHLRRLAAEDRIKERYGVVQGIAIRRYKFIALVACNELSRFLTCCSWKVSVTNPGRAFRVQLTVRLGSFPACCKTLSRCFRTAVWSLS